MTTDIAVLISTYYSTIAIYRAIYSFYHQIMFSQVSSRSKELV